MCYVSMNGIVVFMKLFQSFVALRLRTPDLNTDPSFTRPILFQGPI